MKTADGYAQPAEAARLVATSVLLREFCSTSGGGNLLVLITPGASSVAEVLIMRFGRKSPDSGGR